MTAGVVEAIVITPVKGVTYDPMPGGGSINPTKVWRVRSYTGGKERTLGRFATVAEANEAMQAHYAIREQMSRICERTDMSVAACYHCRGVDLPSERSRESKGPRTPSSRRSDRVIRPPEIVIAHRDFRYPCADCGGRLQTGQRMRSNTGGLLVHEVCSG